MDDLQRLAIESACRALVHEAAACTDAGRADDLAALFTADAVLVRPGGAPLHGRAAIREAYAQRPAERISRHLVTNLRVEPLGADAARVTSLVLVWFGSTADADGPRGRPARGEQAVGEFDDRMERTAEGWRIARRDARFVLHVPAAAG